MQNRPLRFGLLIELEGNVDIEGYKTQIRNLISKECITQRIDLLTLAGGSWIRSPYNSDEKLRNSIYSLINKNNLDGLIILYTVIEYSSRPENDQLFEKFDNLPVVLIGLTESEMPSVAVNNSGGIKDLVDHLIVHHNFKDIGFITGPENNFESAERLNAFKESLKKYDIIPDPDFIEKGNFLFESGKQAVIEMINRGKIPQAIVAANDQMALGAITALKKLGYKVPQDIAVVGFDNFYKANIVNPPLTTVAQPYEKIAFNSINLLKRIINKKSIDQEHIVLNPKLIIRGSCGCIPHYHSNIEYDSNLIDYSNNSHQLFYNEAPLERNADKSLLVPIIAGFSDFLRTGNINEQYILTEIQLYFSSFDTDQFYFEEWNNFFSKLSAFILPSLKTREEIIAHGVLFQKIRLICSETWFRQQARFFSATQLRTEHLHLMSIKLGKAQTLQQFLKEYRIRLKILEVDYCQLYLSESELLNNQYSLSDSYSENLHCISFIKNNIEQLKKFKIVNFNSILNRENCSLEDPASFVVEPLFACGQKIGILIIQSDVKESIFYESLRENISGALYTIFSAIKTKELSDKLDQTLSDLKKSNNQLKEIS